MLRSSAKTVKRQEQRYDWCAESRDPGPQNRKRGLSSFHRPGLVDGGPVTANPPSHHYRVAQVQRIEGPSSRNG